MKIAINTRFLLPKKMEGFGWYTFEIVKRLVENHPEHTFLLFFDRKYDDRFVFGENAIPIVINPPARHPILFYAWFEVGVKRALKKHKADIFFSPDGYLSLASNCIQIPVIHDINFEHNPEDLPVTVRKYLTRFFPKFARKATHIITVSEYSKKDIAKTYQISPEKITAIWNGASELYKPLPEGEIISIREKYTEGLPYFLFVGALSPRKNLNRLIEAFSLYHQNNPGSVEPLIIVGSKLFLDDSSNSIPKNVQDKILFLDHLPIEELTKVMAAAKIFTYVPYFEGFGIPLVEAMKCGIPILSGNLTSLPEVAGDAVQYCDPFNTSDISEKMTVLAKDEALRNEFIEKSLERAKLFSWDNSAKEVWNVLSACFPKKQ